jgi:hypothetical protein
MRFHVPTPISKFGSGLVNRPHIQCSFPYTEQAAHSGSQPTFRMFGHCSSPTLQALKERMRGLLGAQQTDYVTEVKGPGQVIGDVGIDPADVARHKHTARARDQARLLGWCVLNRGVPA